MRRRALFALAGAAVFCVFFAPALSPGRFLFRRDVYLLYLPLEEFVAGQLRAGHFPVWWPLDGLGNPLVGSSVAALLHPRHLLDLVLSPDQALKWGMLLCYPAAAWGAGRLAGRLGAGFAGQALSALGYGLAGYLLSMSDNPPYLLSAATLPWTALAAEALGRGPSRRTVAALGLAWAFALWSGDVQSALLQGLLALAIALSHGASRERARALGGAGGLAALLTSPLLPSLAAAAATEGRLAGVSREVALRWSMPPVRLLELAFGAPWPHAYTSDFGLPFMERYLVHQSNGTWAVCVQAGTPLVALALVGLALANRRAAAVYGTIAGLGLWLALGKYAGLYPALLHVPIWSAFRYPEKLLAFGLLGLATLAGLGTSRLLRAPRGVPVALGLAALGLALLAALSTAGSISAALHALDAQRGSADPDTVEAVRTAARWSFGSSALILAVLAFAAWNGARRLLWLAPLLQLAQALPLAGWAVETAPTEWLTRPSPLQAGARALPGGRICSRPLGYHFEQPPQGPGTQPIAQAQLAALVPDLSARAGLGNINPALPGSPSALGALCPAPHCGGRCERIAGAAGGIVEGARFAALQQGAGLERLKSTPDPDLVLYADPGARPFAEPTAVHFVPDERAALAALLARPERPPDEVAMVGSGPDVPAPRGSVEATRPAPERLSVSAQLDAPGWIVLREWCAPGWRVTLDGAPLPLARADLMFCAASLPAGAHRLELRFVPPGWPWLWLSYAAGLLLTAALLLGPKASGADPKASPAGAAEETGR